MPLSVGVTVAVSLKEGMGFELAEVVTERGEHRSFGGKWEGRQDGLRDGSGAPPAQLGSAVKQDFHKAEPAGVPDFDAGISVFPDERGRAQRWTRGKST